MRLAVLVPLLTACSAPDLTANTTTPADAAAVFAHSLNVIPVEVTVAGATQYVSVDTGDPESILDGSYFTGVADPAFTTGSDAQLMVGGVTVPSAFVINSFITDISSGLDTVLYGNLGCSVTCGYATSFDYAAATVALHTSMDQVTLPAGVGSDHVVPFSLEGGHAMNLPVSRVIVPVTIDGTTYHMMVDSGATSVTVSAAVFSALTADGRATAPNNTTTTSGTDTGSITRARKITLDGIDIAGAIVETDPSFDTILDNISADVGSTVDGSLGGTFLRNFFVTFDYPDSELHLAAYDDPHFALDAAHRVGITIAGPAGEGYTVTAVWGDAAAQGIKVGDAVIGIDGRNVFAFHDAFEVQAALLGDVGKTRHIEIGNLLRQTEDADLEVKIEERLPL